MALYLQVKNNQVSAVWDTLPPAGVGNDGWRNAVEVRPAITLHRQGYTAHRFDLTTDPVQIIYDTYNIGVDERKAGMKDNATEKFQQVMRQQMRDPSTYDPAALTAARDGIVPRLAVIDAATTHDQLDALV